MRPSHRAVETPALPRAAEAKGEKTIAVLPFKSHGAPDWVQQGLLEEIIDTLSMTRGLRVRPFGVVEPFVGSVTPARDVGRQLGVSVVIEGSVRAAGPDLRFSTRAIGVDDGFQIWAQKWQRPAGEILEVSDDAARAIAGALTSSLELPERGTQAPLAAEMYFRARAEFRGAAHARETIEKVVGLFDAAVSLAPKDPHVLAGAANAHARLAFFSRGEQITRARERAQEYADRAIAAAPHLGDPWVAIATLRNYAGDYAGAGRVLTSALKLAPNHPKARELLGRLMIELGDLESGNELLAGALALDPSCTDPRWDLSRGLALRGEIDRARALLALPCEHTALLQRAWMKLRLAMWFPDEDAKRRAVEEPIEDVGAVGKAVLGLKYLFTHGRISDATRAFLTEAIDNGTPRIRLMAGQTYAEYVAYAGEGADAVVAIVQRAADDALLDIAWIDGCPLLKDARKDPSWPALRRKVEERANAVRAAIRE
jgi:serine/threonine-protein kinase